MGMVRGKGKVTSDYSLKDIYKFYKAHSDGEVVSYKEFRRYVTLITSYIMHNILYEKMEFIVPQRLGSFRIKRRKNKIIIGDDGEVQTNYLKPDYKKCWGLWREQYPNTPDEDIAKIPNKEHIYHLNQHSDGYYNRFFWDKLTCNIRNQTAYSFTLIRKWKQEINRLSNQNEMYYE